MNSSMSNFVRLSLYDDIENYLSIPYHLDERTNFSERYPKQRDGIVTKGYSESLKQIISTPREMRRYVRPPSIKRNEAYPQLIVHRTKPVRQTMHEEGDETYLMLPKSCGHFEIVKSSKESIQNPISLRQVKSVSTDTLDMNMEDNLKKNNLKRENIILEQQKDIAQVQTLVFYLSEQLMLNKFTENITSTEGESLLDDPLHHPCNHPQRKRQGQFPVQQRTMSDDTENQEDTRSQNNSYLKLFSDKYTETNGQLSINTTASVLNSQVKYGPRNLKATLVTLDNTWLISWDKPESIDSEETTFSAITGYVLSINGIEMKRISSVNVTKSIINLSESVKYPVILKIQLTDENNCLSAPALITLDV
ncbi:unnamed protein product [Schistosoma intercalatum]|nr:unnamed protein product [Schistosoma intercalatum]